MDPNAINSNVLRRHDPEITSILDSTSYVVLYRFSHGAWSKTGLEGALFVYERESPPYFGVFVLNRNGLDNFCEPLVGGWDVDLDEGLVIWRNDGATGTKDDDVIHGIWVYESEHREKIVALMQKLIAISEPTASEGTGREPTPAPPPPPDISHPVPRMPIIPSGQTISLDELFGVTSVTAEPPPITSALPIPSHSTDDDDDRDRDRDRTVELAGYHHGAAAAGTRRRELERHHPQPVKSPDPADLPKGMDLLNNLFQRAGVKGAPSPSSAASNGGQTPPGNAPDGGQARMRRRSSSAGDEYQPYSTPPTHMVGYAQPPPQQQQQPRNGGSGGRHHSRRSSGDSSHGRPDLVKTGGVQPTSMDPAEARMGILSAINHPAAQQQQDASPAGYGAYRPQPQGDLRSSQNQQYAPPPASHHYQPPGGKADGAAGSATRQQYGPVTLSQYYEQSQAAYHSPQSSQGYDPPPQLQQRRSPTRSPPKLQPVGGGGGGGGGTSSQQGGAAFAGNIWPFDNLPKRALSPLNPASQSGPSSHPGQRGYQQLHHPLHYHQPNGRGQSATRPSQQQQQAGGGVVGGGGGGSGYGSSPGGQTFHTQYSAPSSHQTGSPAGSAPQIPDSSRPRQGSHGSNGAGGRPGATGAHVLSPKWAAEAVDDGLVESGLAFQGNQAGPSMEKREFRDAVMNMLMGNPHFVDAVYSRYLRRCAEDRL